MIFAWLHPSFEQSGIPVVPPIQPQLVAVDVPIARTCAPYGDWQLPVFSDDINVCGAKHSNR